MNNYKRIQVIFRYVFKGMLAYLVFGSKSTVGLPRTFPDLLVFEGIMPDKVILDHKKSYLVYFDYSLHVDYSLAIT